MYNGTIVNSEWTPHQCICRIDMCMVSTCSHISHEVHVRPLTHMHERDTFYNM